MKKIMKIVLIGCALLGLMFFVLIKNYSGNSSVIVLTKDVSAGEVINDKMISTKQIPNKALSKNLLTKKEDVIGKTLSMSRVNGDYIPSEIVKKVNIELGQGEIVFSIRMPKDDAKLVKEGGEIALSLISGGNSEPMFVKGIYVMSINSTVTEEENANEQSDLIIAKTSEIVGNKISPYLKDKNYKVLILPQEDSSDKDIKVGENK